MVSFLAARRVEGGRWTIWLFGFNNQINHLVQLLGPSSCVERENKKRKHLHNRDGCVKKELTFSVLIDPWEDNVHKEEKGETHCNTSAIVEKNNWWQNASRFSIFFFFFFI